MSRKKTRRKEAEVACRIVEIIEKEWETTPDLDICAIRHFSEMILGMEDRHVHLSIEGMEQMGRGY